MASAKHIKKRSAVIWVGFVVFVIYAATLVFPFVFMLLNSIKINKEFFTNSIWSLPSSFAIENYWTVLVNFPVKGRLFGATVEYSLISMFLISIIMTLAATVINALVSATSAFVVAKYKFRVRNFIYSLAIFLMIVPVVGTLPAQYRLMTNFGLINNPFGVLLLYSGGFGFSFFLMYGFFKSISWSYAEAAFMDGAGNAKAFWHVMLPLAMPALVSVSIIYAIGIWNDYLTPSIYMRDIPTLAVGLNYILAALKASNAYPESFAAMVIGLMPILIVFSCFQKTIMENTVAGGLKG